MADICSKLMLKGSRGSSKFELLGQKMCRDFGRKNFFSFPHLTRASIFRTQAILSNQYTHLTTSYPPINQWATINRIFQDNRKRKLNKPSSNMSSLLPVAVYGQKIPAGDVMIPATIDFPATVRSPQSQHEEPSCIAYLVLELTVDIAV